MKTNPTLSQSIEHIMGVSKPQERSYKYQQVRSYSSKNVMLCDQYEREKYIKSLENIPITISDSIRYTHGRVGTLKDLYDLLYSPSNKDIEKIKRKVLYSTSNGERPVSDNAYHLWNGFQVIDMDIKDTEIARLLKEHIFNGLCTLPWFIGVALSSSGQGLHIYTKIQIPESVKEYQSLVRMFRVNFRHKYSTVYIACLKAKKLNITKEQLQKWMDISMFRPQQGVFIGFDENAMFSTSFFEDFIYVEFAGDGEWNTHKDLKDVFERWEYFDDLEDTKVEIVSQGPIDLQGRYHYKHTQRWRLANTLVSIYGLELGYKYLRAICDAKIKDDELRAICQTAHRHNKGADDDTIALLNTKHGFSIRTKNNDNHELLKVYEDIENPNEIFKPSSTSSFHIDANEYLGHISNKLEVEFQDHWISILEAGPGLGKTEFVKSLARKKKVMLVMPFTSTIQSKTEQDEFFKVAYGNKQINLNFPHGMATTIDKFSRLDPLDVNMAGYDYIFIDESHLLFISGYRDVMSNSLNLINQLQVPVILMTGTPTGEFLFFKGAHHVKVTKTDNRQKSLDIMVVQDSPSIVPQICAAMVQDLKDGNRILFPTNQGTSFAHGIAAGVKSLCLEQGIKEPNIQYYKRSNMGDDFMDTINHDATIEDIDILMCTSFLSVGVDILDKYDFRIYFSETCLPAECDQWCNRLRNNDLIARLYVALYDSAGNPNNITSYKKADFETTDEETRMAIDMVEMCNDYLQRDGLVHHYNNIIQRILRDNRYVRYDGILNQYKIDMVAFMLSIYENRLRDYCMQIPVFMRGMQCYGYDMRVQDVDDLGAVQIELKEHISSIVSEYKDFKTGIIEQIVSDLNNDLIYAFGEVLGNKLELRKGELSIGESCLYVPDIEVFNKIAPHIVSLYKHYDIQDIQDIFEFVRDGKKHYNMAELGRLRTLFNIVESKEARLLDIKFEEFMTDVYNFVDRSEALIPKAEYEQFFTDFIVAHHEVGELTHKKLNDIYIKVFRVLVNVRISKKGVRMSIREVLWQTRNEKNMSISDFVLNDFINQYIEILNSEKV